MFRAAPAHLVRAFLSSAIAFAFAGCSAQSPNCVYAFSAVETVPPMLAYPESGATGVPDDFGTLLYYFGTSDLKVRLKAGTSIVATSPATVPSPLPSPLATPQYGDPAPSGARAVPSLSPQTTYTVQYFYTSVSGCPMMTTSGYATLGTFTTQ